MSANVTGNGFWIKNNVLIKYNGDDKTVVIPSGVEYIKDNAFFKCAVASNVIIPDTVNRIGKLAFYGCSSLLNVSIPESVINIEKDAFLNCERLRFVKIPSRYAAKTSTWWKKTFDEEILPIIALSNFDKSMPLTKYVLKNRVYCVESLVLRKREDLIYKFLEYYPKIPFDELTEMIQVASEKESSEAVSILVEYKNKMYSQEEIEKIEQNKLEKALGLKKYTVSDWKKIFCFKSNGGFITITSYKGMEEHVIIPEKIGKSIVSEIGDDAFRGCGFLKSVVFPQTVLKIGNRAFRDCVALKKVITSDGVESIGCDAFFRCSALESISIPSVKCIFREAFLGCGFLSEITLLENEIYFGWGAFNGCNNLIIKGKKGSNAEKYAENMKITFEEI